MLLFTDKQVTNSEGKQVMKLMKQEMKDSITTIMTNYSILKNLEFLIY